MKKIIARLAVLSAAMFLLIAGTVRTIRTDKSISVITYHMVHPMHSWDGVNKSFDGVVQYSDSSKQVVKVAILAKVADFNSDNSNRDSHTIEVTEAIKYPTISFVSTGIVYDAKILVKGNLTFHGVTKPIQFYITEQTVKNRKVVEGGFEIKLTDFKIDPPSLMFVKAEDKIALKFTVQFDV
jgi:polyisoprenoid-binding protein YceI